MSATSNTLQKRTIRKKQHTPQIINLTLRSNKKKLHTIYSQLRVGAFFDRFVINRLNAWFKNNGKIIDIVKHERRRRGLEEKNTTVESSVYGTNKENTTLQILIKKRGKDYIHLSIHIAPDYLGTGNKDAGMIHVVKNAYTPMISGKKNYYLRSIYAVEKPQDKPQSLQFSIQQRYNTPNIHNNINQYDDDVKQEIDVITAVLNQLFDETNENYIGLSTNTTPIEQNTNNILRNMNTRTKYIERKNVGTYFFSKGGKNITKKHHKF